jgi:hypothetical protein
MIFAQHDREGDRGTVRDSGAYLGSHRVACNRLTRRRRMPKLRKLCIQTWRRLKTRQVIIDTPNKKAKLYASAEASIFNHLGSVDDNPDVSARDLGMAFFGADGPRVYQGVIARNFAPALRLSLVSPSVVSVTYSLTSPTGSNRDPSTALFDLASGARFGSFFG